MVIFHLSSDNFVVKSCVTWKLRSSHPMPTPSQVWQSYLLWWWKYKVLHLLHDHDVRRSYDLLGRVLLRKVFILSSLAVIGAVEVQITIFSFVTWPLLTWKVGPPTLCLNRIIFGGPSFCHTGNASFLRT